MKVIFDTEIYTHQEALKILNDAYEETTCHETTEPRRFDAYAGKSVLEDPYSTDEEWRGITSAS